MTTPSKPFSLEEIRNVMQQESAAIDFAMQRLGQPCVEAAQLIADCQGKVVVTGVGKSGCVARKAAATFSSTGTPAFFLHPNEAAHGDLGMVSHNDVVVAISNSGQTAELISLIPYWQRFEIPWIALTSATDSELAQRSSCHVLVEVPAEADDLGLAPTSSSTVMMALCDALAVAIAKQRGLTADQFAMFHPGGSLGRKLLVTTASIMHRDDAIPVGQSDMALRQAIGVIGRGGLGTLIITEQSKVTGILTDGDIRRVLAANENPLSSPVGDFMIQDPILLTNDTLAAEALRIMKDHAITVLPVVDSKQQLVGVLHLHDLIKAGLA